MRPIALLGAVVALVLAVIAMTWLSSFLPASNRVAKTPPEVPLSWQEKEKADKAAAEADASSAEPKEKRDEPLPANPFQFAKEGPQPVAELLEDRFSFGKMILGDTGSHEFLIRNIGDAPLKLAKGTSTCKCTIPTVGKEAIPPGGEVLVKLSWEPIGPDEAFSQQATVWTNDPNQPKLSLIIEGQVVAESFQVPIGSLALNEVGQGQSRTVTGYILAHLSKDLAIKEVETSGPAIDVKYEPVEEALLKERDVASGFKFDITVAPGQDVGLIRESVTVHTNLAKTPIWTWQIVGNRSGPVRIVGPNWFEALQLVRLGKFEAAKGVEQRLSVFMAKTDTPAELKEVQTAGPIKVRMEHDPLFENPDRDRYWLWVEFPKDGAAGSYHDDAPLSVEVILTHPQVPSIRFNVVYEAI